MPRKPTSAAAAGLGAAPPRRAPARRGGRWGRAPGLRPQAPALRFAALGDGAPEVPPGAYTRLSHLLEDAAERAGGGLAGKETPSSACAGRVSGSLASLGSAPRRRSRRAGLGDASDLVRELTESSASSLASDPSDPEALVRELTAPKKAAVKASFPADPELKEVEIGGSVVPPEETFALPGETRASADDVAGDDVVVTEDPVEVGGSIAPPKEGDSALDALELAGMASLVDAAPAGEDAADDVARETAEEEEEEEEDVFDLFEDPGVLDEPDEASSEGGDALEDALEDASDDVNRESAEEEGEDALEDPGSPDEAELEVEAALELEDAQKVDVEPEVDVEPKSTSSPKLTSRPKSTSGSKSKSRPKSTSSPKSKSRPKSKSTSRPRTTSLRGASRMCSTRTAARRNRAPPRAPPPTNSRSRWTT